MEGFLNRSDIMRLRRGCDDHPAHKGKGDPHFCLTCLRMNEARDRMVKSVTDLISEIMVDG